MAKRKSLFQKISIISAIVSSILAVIAGIWLFLRIDDYGFNNPISTSLMASIFFFLLVAFVLVVIWSTDIPSFRFDKSEDEN